MRAERGGSKSSGFFNLFDWNKKSRKKLFTVSPEGSKIGRRIEEPLPSTHLRMMDEEEAIGVSSIKGSSDYSCASSMTEDDLLNGSKPAGVVARLMGLDSLPAPNISEPYSTPFRSFRETPREYSTRDPLTRNLIRNETNNNNNYVKKMPSSPIERFQMEAIPSSRSAKSLPVTYHKLLSPIKNPNFTYGRNASQIMEAAAKILEPRLEINAGNMNNNNNTREKVCSVGTGRINPLRVSDPLRPEKASRLLQLSRVHAYERGNNREEDIVIFRPSPDLYEVNNNNLSNNNGLNARGNKGKSVSLAIQAKVNVQKREGVNLSNRNCGMAHKDTSTNHITGNSSSSTSHQRTGMSKQQKKANTNSSKSNSPVLRQNNQKQNCIGNRAGKSGTGKSIPSQQGRKSGTSETSSAKQKSRFSSSNLKPRKENLDFSNSNESEKDNCFNHNKDFPQKKRLVERNNNINTDNNINNKNKNSVLVDEYTKWNKETKDTTDVVSFTFTSPLLKQTGGSSFGTENLGLIQVKGNKDALSLLLENKLRELTAKTNEKSIDFGKSELDFDLRGKEIQKNGFEFEFDALEDSEKAGAMGIFDFSNDHSFRVMHQGECSKTNDIYEDEEMKQLSPFSVLGEESCSTSESSTSIDGSKVSPSSAQAQNTASSRKVFSSDSEVKLTDYACSQLLDTSSKLFKIVSPNIKFRKGNPELDYITDIISNADLEKMGVEGAQLDSPLFDKLERKRSRTELESESTLCLADRKLIYDCVKECLDAKLEMHFRSGYQEWNKGIYVRRKGIMHKEIYGEIEGRRKMCDLNVDEIVERDMVTKLDYRVDSIEIGTYLEAVILDSLIAEVIADAIRD